MTRQEHSDAKRFSAVSKQASKTALYALLIGGVSCTTGLAITTGAIAKTTAGSASEVPSAEDLLGPVMKAQPLPSAPASATPPSPQVQAPVAPSSVPPTPVEVRSQPIPSAPTLSEGATIEFSTGTSSADADTEASAAPLTPVPPAIDLSGLKNDIPTVDVDYGSSYIDTTDYSVGATPVPDIVLTERSTGCKATLHQGQGVPSSICGGAVSGPLAVAGGNGNLQPTAFGSAPSPLPQVNSVQIGPLSIGLNGVQITRRLSVQDYYNRTERPHSLSGNDNTNLMFPLSIPALISSPFGLRTHPIFGNVRMHTGTDIAAPMGTPVVAAYSGRVAISDFLGGYGLAVVIGHNEKSSETLYGHLSEVFVKAGEWVEQGEVIGRVGSTGNSTGPHLHFELRKQTTNGWAAVNSGSLLQQGLAKLHEGFQLGPDFSLADAGLLQSVNGEFVKLAVPKTLQQGKNATKEEVSADVTTSAEQASGQNAESLGQQPMPVTPHEHPQNEPGDWVSPKELVSKDEDI